MGLILHGGECLARPQLVDDLASFVVKFCYLHGSPRKLVLLTYSLLEEPAVFLKL
jgi:hypothetical protein